MLSSQGAGAQVIRREMRQRGKKKGHRKGHQHDHHQQEPSSAADFDQADASSSPHSNGGNQSHRSSRSSSGASSNSNAKPTISLSSHIEGMFSSTEHSLGGSFAGAALEHWLQCDKEKKTSLVQISDDDIFAALKELHITSQCNVIGDPTEETAQEVVKDFLYALEVNDGTFRFPDAPSLEYIGILVALETNLLLSMEETNLLQHALMTWFLILWRQRYWWIGYLVSIFIILFNNRISTPARDYILKGLDQVFVSGRRWQPYVRWKSETYFVSFLSIVMTGGSMRWFILVLAATMAGLGIDFLAAKATNVDDEAGLNTSKGVILWVQKVLLLILSFSSYVTFFIIAFYYFPSALILTASTLYFAVGFGIRLLFVLLHDYMLPEKWRHSVDSWWNGREGLNRAVVVLSLVILIPAYTFYRTWHWTIAWRGTSMRLLSVLIAVNIVSVEDLSKGVELAKSWMLGIWGVVSKEWKKYWEEKVAAAASPSSSSSSSGNKQKAA